MVISDTACAKCAWRVGRIPQAAAWSRAAVTTQLRAWKYDTETVRTGELIVSELVGNAIKHAAGDEIEVNLYYSPEKAGLCISVKDSEMATPRPADESAEIREDGRGLRIVKAYAREYGWDRVTDGRYSKVVWALFD